MSRILAISSYKPLQHYLSVEAAIARLYKNELIIDIKEQIKDFVQSIQPTSAKARLLSRTDFEELIALLKEDFEKFESDLLIFDEDLLHLRAVFEDLEQLNSSKFEEGISIINKVAKDVDDLQKDCENIDSDMSRLSLANSSEKRLKQIFDMVNKFGIVKRIPKLIKLLNKIVASLMKIARVMNKIAKNQSARELRLSSRVDLTDVKKDLTSLLTEFKSLAA